jgi:signal transduction histidine kinase
MAQFWDAADRMFALARSGGEEDARMQIRLSLQARQASLSTAVARLLVENNEREEQTGRRVRQIYDDVQRQVQWFLGGTLTAILFTSLYLISANRRIFDELELLSERRREIAQQLIATREAALRQISRELHDELGQVLTAMGSMLERAGRHAPEDSPLRADLREVCEIAQATLEKVRALSQTLHPAMLEEAGLEKTVEWYLSTVGRQLGLTVDYERTGSGPPVDDTISIHVYRVLQEALNNVARHSGATRAWVRLRLEADGLQLEVEDHGRGTAGSRSRRGLGIVTMRERSELVGGTIEFDRPAAGGFLVRLKIPRGTVRSKRHRHSDSMAE